ncbi:MAG TPA: acyltransferase [bacterium]|nr:acyltransferase [bacterium]HPP88618.1 acyltransferase [bacterium]
MTKKIFVHQTAIIEKNAEIGENTRVWAFAHIMSGAKIGTNCNICDNVYIEGGAVVGNNVKIKNGVAVWDKVIIEDDVFIGPFAVFTNDINPRSFKKKEPSEFLKTIIKTGATIGANATIVCGITIGKYAFIGAGAVVTKNVPDYALIYGNPAKIKGYVCECGEKLNSDFFCEICKKKIYI